MLRASLICIVAGLQWAAALPLQNLVLDLNAASGVKLDDKGRVLAWTNQAATSPAKDFTPNGKGRAVPESGMPEFLSATDTRKFPVIRFRQQELVNSEEDVFDPLTQGSGHTWYAIVAIDKLTSKKKDVNAFFGNLRNTHETGGYFEGFWGVFRDDQSVYAGVRNGVEQKQGSTNNPEVTSRTKLEKDRFYLIAGRMGAGEDTVKVEIFVNNPVADASATVPVNKNANPSKMAIGQERDATNHPGAESFNGDLARLLIYDKPHDPAEMKAVFENLTEQYAITTEGSRAEAMTPFTPAKDMHGAWDMQVDPALPNALILGDSISIGYTRDVRSLLAGKANVFRPMNPTGKQPENCGDTPMGIKGLDKWLGATRWDVIHFNWGLWDLCYRNPEVKTQGNRDKVNGNLSVTPQQYEQNLETIVTRLKATGAKLIWANTTVVPEGEVGRITGDDVKYNAIAARVMKRHGIPTDDLHALTKDFAGKFFIGPRDVHFTREGSLRMAEQVANEITSALPVKNPTAPAKTLTATYSPATGIGEEPGVMRRDPSDIIQVGDLYHVWYTKGKFRHGYDATIFHATSPDGHVWTETGEALARGPAGAWDEQSVFTPNILVEKNKYWLFYTAVPKPFTNGNKNTPPTQTAIGLATADSPDGPWTKLPANPIMTPSADHQDFDSLRIDDACIIVREGKYWLYYKGRQWDKSPAQTKLGVAIAAEPQGPYIKYPENPLIHGNHEVSCWPQGKGVTAMIGTTGPEALTRTLQYAEDGLHFSKTHDIVNVPTGAGAFRPEAFTDSSHGELIDWGLHLMERNKRTLPYLERFELKEAPALGN